jgi:NAD(P)-dependent dehydrogenase (short-subunit alcohol dehydrogenase family)
VVVVGRRKEVAQQVASEIKNGGRTAVAITADVCDEEQLISLQDDVLKSFGRIDILVNAAGGNLPGATIPAQENFFDLSIDEFKKVVDLNLTGTVLPCKIFGESMAQHKKGCIVNISSVAADRALTRVVGYSPAKAAVTNFTQWLAVEMNLKFGEGLRVNAIAPGFFLTEQNKTLLTNTDGSLTERGDNIIRNTPYKRFGVPEELCGALIYLCADSSAFVNGTVLEVDGGFSAYSGV